MRTEGVHLQFYQIITVFIGKGVTLLSGSDVTIIACGVMVARSLEASKILNDSGISARVVNMSTIKPIDSNLLKECALETGCFVTAEDHNIIGGLGSAVSESVSRSHPVPIEFVGVNDTFGEPDVLAIKYNITSSDIIKACLRAIARKSASSD